MSEIQLLRIAAIATALVSTSAFAQTSPEQPDPHSDAIDTLVEAVATDPEILVDAPPTPRERQRELRKMITKIIRRPRVGRTVETFFDAPCPKVFGVPEEAAQAIEARMLLNAEQLGANRRNPRKNCIPNISVIFIPPRAGPAKTWFNTDSKMLRHLLSFERAWVAREHGPARAWLFNAVRGPDGQTFIQGMNRIPYATRVRSKTSVEIVRSVVMIELQSTRNKSLTQLADYATMRSFANIGGIDPDDAPVAATILTLFQDDKPPAELTSFDRAFLSTLYRIPITLTKGQYYSSIARGAARKEREAGLAPGQQ